MGDDIRTYGVYYKTAGFSDYEYLSQSDARRYIGVKKGLYTISVKSYTPVYGVKVKFNKVKESKYGTKKGEPNTVVFDPVKVRALKLEVQLPSDKSAGIFEWEVK